MLGEGKRYGEGIDPGNLLIGDLLVAVMLLMTVAASYATWRLVERPGQELFRRWAARLFAVGVRQSGREQRRLEATASGPPFRSIA